VTPPSSEALTTALENIDRVLSTPREGSSILALVSEVPRLEIGQETALPPAETLLERFLLERLKAHFVLRTEFELLRNDVKSGQGG